MFLFYPWVVYLVLMTFWKYFEQFADGQAINNFVIVRHGDQLLGPDLLKQLVSKERRRRGSGLEANVATRVIQGERDSGTCRLWWGVGPFTQDASMPDCAVTAFCS